MRSELNNVILTSGKRKSKRDLCCFLTKIMEKKYFNPIQDAEEGGGGGMGGAKKPLPVFLL